MVYKKSSPPLKEEYPKGEVVFNQKPELFQFNSNNSNLPHLKLYRNQLRNNLTPAEAKLWSLLKNSQLENRKFRRQHSVGNYILDFYCPSEKLAVELDGQGHFESPQIEYDIARDLYLKSVGITVLRFENKLVFEQTEFVLAAIVGGFSR